MEKSDLEKALEAIPTLEDMNRNDVTPEEKYRVLKSAEIAYEQLATSGQDVSDQLRERRYQIAELAAYTLEVEAGNIRNMLTNRSEDWIGDLPNLKPLMNECVAKLDTYLQKLYPNSFKETRQQTELFPEP